MVTQPVAAVSIDLDEIRLYRAIHGLSAKPAEGPLGFERAVPRALAWATRLGVPLTFFVVADDLRLGVARDVLDHALGQGHAVESHSQTHPYDLVRLPAADIEREVAGSFDAIEAALGVRPHGFRAPGYTLSDAVLDALERAGASFDASAFPCPAYYLAKLAAIGAMFERGKQSASIAASPTQLLCPTEAYRPGRPWWRRGDRPLLEIPMRVTRGPRLPVIGTSLALAGERMAPALADACGLPALFSLELHAMDFLDVADGLEELRGHQPELWRPRAERERALDRVIERLRMRGYHFATLRDAVSAIAERQG